MPFLCELFLDKDSALLVVLVTLGNESSELSLKNETIYLLLLSVQKPDAFHFHLL